MKRLIKTFIIICSQFLLILYPNMTYALEAWLSPDIIDLNMAPNQSTEFDLVFTTGTPPIKKLDVVFVIDTTGSMGAEIENAKRRSIDIMNNIRSKVEDAYFGVVSFRDYYGSYSYSGYYSTYGSSGDKPYYIEQTLTNDISSVSDAIQSLYASGGGDWPESYTRALFEASKPSMNWREDSKKIIVLIGDAPTHDMDFAGYNFGGDPGEDGIANTSDDLDFETVVQSLRDKKIMVLALQAGSSAEAAATFKGVSIGFDGLEGTNGQYYSLASAEDVSSKIIEMVSEEVLNIKELGFYVPEDFKSWISFSPSTFINVGPRESKTVKVNVHIPPGTLEGTYTIPIEIRGDGSLLDTSIVNITVDQSHSTAQSVEFISTNFGVLEDAGNVSVTVMRNNGIDGEFNVDYSIVEKEAKSGEDFIPVTGTITFLPGEKFKTLTVPIIDDGITEEKEGFIINLSNPTNGVTLGEKASATVTIVDNERTNPGILELSSSAYYASEGDNLMVTVNRLSGSEGPITVNYEVNSGTAMSESDFESTSGTLTFGDRETTKSFYVKILSDDVDDDNETAYIKLSSPSNGALLGINSTAMITIKNKYDGVKSLTATPVDVTVAPGKSVPISIVANMSDGSTK
ncbi:Calx-beta domain-containing protein, partial [[Anoxybacillus] calidus]